MENEKSLFRYFIECFTRKYWCFTGRARRREYWGFYLFILIFAILISILLFTVYYASLMNFGNDPVNRVPGSAFAMLTLPLIILGLLWLILLPPSLGVAIRRLHDTGRSGWWIGGQFIVAILAGFCQSLGVTSFNMTLLGLSSLLNLVNIGLGITIFIFCVLDSQYGINKYGENPKGIGNEGE